MMTTPDIGFLENTEPPAPSQVSLTDARLEELVADLAGSDAEVQSPSLTTGQLSGRLDGRMIEVGGQGVEVPVSAIAKEEALDRRSGLIIKADDPVPKGTSIWIAGEAARHVHSLLSKLDAISDA